MTARLASHLTRHPGHRLADVAYTLHIGRRDFRYRRSLVVGQDRADTVTALRSAARCPSRPARSPRPSCSCSRAGLPVSRHGRWPVPGGAGMRRTVDECCDVLVRHMGMDLRDVLFPGPKPGGHGRRRTTGHRLGPARAVRGAVRPGRAVAILGHPTGRHDRPQYRGVRRHHLRRRAGFEDALRLLARRGRLISALPSGSMLGVMAPVAEVADLLDDGVCLAATTPRVCASYPARSRPSTKWRMSWRPGRSRFADSTHPMHFTPR